MRPLGVHGRVVRAALLALLACASLLAPGTALAHEGHAGHEATVAAADHTGELYDEALIPGLDSATDFAVAGNGDVYVALHDGDIYRYSRTPGSTRAYPRYSLTPQLIWRFQTTRQYDRGLVGITLDAQFDAGQRYLYALITRGSADFNDNVAGGNPNGIRRTGAAVRIAVPASGQAQPSDLKTIVGADAPADVDSTCKPFTKGMAGAYDDTEAAPNGVELFYPTFDTPPYAPNTFAVKNPLFKESNIYPDGDLSTRADGAYDCIPSDGDTHGLGSIQSAPDGSLFISVGDATPFQIAQGAQFRTYNQESYVGKILRVDRNGKGVGDHPFCPTETDLSRVCTKVWAMGLRNAFRIQVLPPDGASGTSPTVAVGDVGDFSVERLKIAHPGDNLGWPCWEGTYYNDRFANPTKETAVTTGWGGPGLRPTDGRVSCEVLTATGSGRGGNVKPRSDVQTPDLEYFHATAAFPDGEGAAIVAGPKLEAKPGADADVALPSAWTGSMVFGDFARGWLYRIGLDEGDPQNTDHDAGLRFPADEGRAPAVVTESTAGDVPDPLLDRIGTKPVDEDWYRLTSRQGPDGALWYVRYGGSSQGGGLVRLRRAPRAPAGIQKAFGQCTRTYGQDGSVTLTGLDAGAGATYAWDITGDGLPDAGRINRTTTISKTDLNTTAFDARLTVKAAGSESTASCYLGRGPAPDLTISGPATGTKVVLGRPVVVTGSRPANDRYATEIDDDKLQWKAVTVHGSNHTHPLLDRTGATEEVTLADGETKEQRMQFMVIPTGSHELGSFTRVRFYAAQSDPNLPQQTIDLYPQPVQVRFVSSPAGAQISVSRSDMDPSVVPRTPGSVELAAGYEVSKLIASPTFVDATGQTQYFRGWSDGQTTAVRSWTVRATDGDAPVAQYGPTPLPTPTPTPDATPVPDLTPQPIVTPVAGLQSPELPAAPTPTPTPGPVPTPAPVALPPTASELQQAPFAVGASGVKRRASIKAVIRVGRVVDPTGLAVKTAIRSSDCRWWSFSRKAFAAPKRAGGSGTKASRAAQCKQPPSWKLAPSSWSSGAVTANIALGGKLKRGRYAVRVRVQRGRTVLADRVRALVVK